MKISENIKNFNKVSEEIQYPVLPEVVSVSSNEIKQLIEESKHTDRKRMRLCTHTDPSHGLHEMLIVHEKDTYVRPHKHLGRTESFHIIQGRTDVVVYEDDGNIREVVQMGEYNSGYNFYYRLNQSLFHTMLIYSDHLVFQETTSGPFDPALTLFAPWSPAPSETEASGIFLKNLIKDIANITASSKL
ncbi:WbuC family cupin fold metalloprotein [Leptospira ilyithenensis]|uniref:Cupin fold metalloprotein, WbuC family n=1 Tax=Leptospira ilyithenensis TaxID=2484901 RepID=A0A4R9LPT1_9LEPT|nr:WbuC family cupin fold metalloprotein [Leptospira ilyithenensis]TGN07970.1 cupin fold metalloprotein, WbuC family [Leptospira ilyithenensis]